MNKSGQKFDHWPVADCWFWAEVREKHRGTAQPDQKSCVGGLGTDRCSVEDCLCAARPAFSLSLPRLQIPSPFTKVCLWDVCVCVFFFQC